MQSDDKVGESLLLERLISVTALLALKTSGQARKSCVAFSDRLSDRTSNLRTQESRGGLKVRGTKGERTR